MSAVRLRILLIEDDEDDFVLTRELLAESYGDDFDLVWEFDDQAGLKALRAEVHDVCLLDYRLGERSGLELLRAALDGGCDTPVIVLTGQGDRSVDVEAMRAGAADFLVKGQFAAPLLERSIRYAIERQRAVDALRRSEARFALAVRGANDGLWDWDLHTNRLYYAPRWKSMLGYGENEIGDAPEEWLSRIHESDAANVHAEIEAHRAGETPHLQVESRMLHADGGYRWVLTRGLAVRDAHGRAFRMAGSQTDITQRRQAEDRLHHNAFHDALTGLPNRALFLERLGRALVRIKRRANYRFAVLFLDLDGFKLINDSLGHQAGDHFLIAVSRVLETCSRKTDTVGRLGGDEFVVLMDEFDDASDVFRLADRVLEHLKHPILVNGHCAVATASIGIALGDSHYESGDDMLRDADIAMYRAKARGKAGRVIFDRSMHTRAVARMKLESDMRLALSRDEYRLYYQPIISLRTGRITGFEALVRWEHPQRGLIGPEEFLQIAEETGLILPLGVWVLRAAAQQWRAWQDLGNLDPPLTMGVNLSGRQFFHADLIPQLERVLQETGIEAAWLRIEISESMVMERVQDAPSVLSRLNAAGVRLALDDFGKGYSSLSHLHQFPLDTLKIDRSFIERLGTGGRHAQIVQSIVAMAEGLGLDVVAKGVESALQLAQLREVGCPSAQGFFFARPLTADAATVLLADHPVWWEPLALESLAGRSRFQPVEAPDLRGRVELPAFP